MLALIILLIISGIFYYATPESPDSALKEARDGLAKAREANADLYAPQTYQRAIDHYDSAMAWWGRENKRFVLFRSYTRVDSLAIVSSQFSLEAVEQAERTSRDVSRKTGASIELLQKRLKRIKYLYASLPLGKGFRSDYSQAKLMLEESRIAVNKGELYKAADITGRALKTLEHAEVYAETYMKEYFEGYSEWKKLYEKAIAASARNNSTLIVVDKLAHSLRLYQDGKLKTSYVAEFGPNWLGDKNHQGDQATPEGSYLVTKKLGHNQSRYYKALLLNYPNSDDRERYRSKVKRGQIPSHVDIGGLIEIHGHGGQGFNWTNGCVAVTNKEMDVIFRHASLNTPVLILGSLVPYDDWLKDRLSGSD